MKQEFAVYAYRNVAYEEQVFKVSGNFDSIEEALHFKFFVEQTEINNALTTKEIFASTVIEKLPNEIDLEHLKTLTGEKLDKYFELLVKYNITDF